MILVGCATAGARTGRNVQTAPVPAALAHDPWPDNLVEPEVVGSGIVYRLLGRLLAGTLRVDEQTVRPEVREALLRLEPGLVGPCPATRCGTFILPARAPAEMGFWLAVLDLHLGLQPIDAGRLAHEGRGTVRHVVRTRTRRLGTGGAEGTLTATREVLEFVPWPGVACEAQVKLFRIDGATGGNPSDDAVDSLVRAGDLDAADYRRFESVGLFDQGRGQVFLELREEGTAAKVLEIHVGFDTELLYGAGETSDKVLRCRSDGPLLATGARELGLRFEPGPDGELKVNVFPVTPSRDPLTP
jgi:hypothetical protein